MSGLNVPSLRFVSSPSFHREDRTHVFFLSIPAFSTAVGCIAKSNISISSISVPSHFPSSSPNIRYLSFSLSIYDTSPARTGEHPTYAFVLRGAGV